MPHKEEDPTDYRTPLEILADVIKKLADPRRNQNLKFPSENLMRLGLFLRPQITLDELTDALNVRRHAAVQAVSHINEKILKGTGIRIKGHTVYRVELDDD